MRWLLCDYGEVLSLAQPAATVAEMAAIAGVDGPAFEEAYWHHRPAYDRGDTDASGYWGAVLGAAPGSRLGPLVDADVAGWLRPNQASLAAAARVAQRGLRLAVLSNAPREVAAAIDGLPWLAQFSPRVFSCDLGVVKPEPEAYARALKRLQATPGEVVFVDDRPVNVDAARAAGIEAVVFDGPAVFDQIG